MALPLFARLAAVSAFALLVLASDAAPVSSADCLQVWPYPVYPVHKQANVPQTLTFKWKYLEPDKPWLQQETGRTGYYANVYLYTCDPLGQDPPLWEDDLNSYPTPTGCQTIGVCYSGTRDLRPWTELGYSACWKWDAANDQVVYERLPPLEPNREYWWYVTTACEKIVQYYDYGEAWRFHTASSTSTRPPTTASPVITSLLLRTLVPELTQ